MRLPPTSHILRYSVEQALLESGKVSKQQRYMAVGQLQRAQGQTLQSATLTLEDRQYLLEKVQVFFLW